MKNKEFDKLDVVKVESHINELNNKKADIVEKKMQLETRLSLLKNKIGMGALTNLEYSKICEEQNKLKKDKDFLEAELIAINKQIRSKSTLKEEIRVRAIDDKSTIIEALKNLKNKYQEYSKDYTRVNSTRIMAANFVQELEKIIK